MDSIRSNQKVINDKGILINKTIRLRIFYSIKKIKSNCFCMGIIAVILCDAMLYTVCYAQSVGNPEDSFRRWRRRITTTTIAIPTPFPPYTSTTTTTTTRTTTTTIITTTSTTTTSTTTTTTLCPAPQCHQEITQLGTCQCCPDSSWVWDSSNTSCVRDCTNMVKVMDFSYLTMVAGTNLYNHGTTLAQYTAPDELLGLSTFLNWGGANEKWIKGPGNKWYFIKPNGELYFWDRTPNSATGRLVATLSTDFYETPGLLTNTVSYRVYQSYANALKICGSDGFTYDNLPSIAAANCMFQYFTGYSVDESNHSQFKLYNGVTAFGRASFIKDRCPQSWIYSVSVNGYNLEQLHKNTGRDSNCRYAVIYLDQYGRSISSPLPGKDICEAGLFQFGVASLASPISLLWNGQSKLDKQAESIHFDIDASGAKKPVLWRASETQPLLIYDPEHKGEISDAKQLFGNWTFGGRIDPIAPVSLGSKPNPERKPWANGYEALATLDANNNGKVDEAELKPLGLWFDRNKNGISESGEVLTVKDAGVVALYYKVDRYDGQNKDAYVNRGFDRLLGNKLISGTSVDWYTTIDNPGEQLVATHLNQSISCSDSKHLNEVSTISQLLQTGDKPTSGLSANTATKHTGKVSQIVGPWMWSRTDVESNLNSTGLPQGFLMFAVDEAGFISGHSYAQMYLQNAGEADSMLGIYQLFGKINEANDTQTKFSFEIVAPDGGKVESTAVLIENGTKIRGETIANVPYGEMSVSSKYTWIAKRLPEFAMKADSQSNQ